MHHGASVWAVVDENIIEHICGSVEMNARNFINTMIGTPPHDDRVQVFVTLRCGLSGMLVGKQYMKKASNHHYQCMRLLGLSLGIW